MGNTIIFKKKDVYFELISSIAISAIKSSNNYVTSKRKIAVIEKGELLITDGSRLLSIKVYNQYCDGNYEIISANKLKVVLEPTTKKAYPLHYEMNKDLSKGVIGILNKHDNGICLHTEIVRAMDSSITLDPDFVIPFNEVIYSCLVDNINSVVLFRDIEMRYLVKAIRMY